MPTTSYAHFPDVPESAWRWPSFSPAEIACRGTGATAAAVAYDCAGLYLETDY